MKKILCILLALAVILGLSICALADNSRYVIDEADLLSEQEVLDLEGLFSDISNRCGIDVVVLTVDSLDGYSAESYANNYYDSNGYADNGVLLLLCMNERIWWVSTCGSCISLVDADKIGDEIVSDLSSGDYFDAFYRYGVLCADAVIYGAPDYDDGGNYSDISNTRGLRVPKAILISLLIGAVIGIIVVGIMASRMKSVRKQNHAANYICNGSLQLRQSRDIFLYQNTTRTAKPKNNSSGGGGGGRSHGGGGGRF